MNLTDKVNEENKTGKEDTIPALRLGFVGTGIITTAVVTGFCRAGIPNLTITVSPRNRERALALQETFPEIVYVAASNQQVVDASDWVFAALLPQAADEVLGELTIPAEKKFVNLILSLSTIHARELIGDRELIADVVPLTFAANGFGPSVIYAPGASEENRQQLVDLMSYISTPVVVQDAKQIAILRSITAMMSPYYMLLTRLIDWCVDNGLDEASARAYITEFTSALSHKAAGFDGPLEELAREMTPGGINWQALTHLEELDNYKEWTEILDPILERVTKE